MKALYWEYTLFNIAVYVGQSEKKENFFLIFLICVLQYDIPVLLAPGSWNILDLSL